MGFDTNKFLQANLKCRTKYEEVEDLKAFFPEGEKPQWLVKGLTGQELGACNSAVERNSTFAAVVEGLSSKLPEQVKKAIANLVGGEGVPDDVAKRICMLVLGSVDPKVDESIAVHLCTTFPVEFYQLTQSITTLTGLGYELGK